MKKETKHSSGIVYYSQFGEDKILDEIFKNKYGTCVEVGGFDGVTGSNTLYFEKLGWRCLIVEPMPEYCELIKKSRSCELVQSACSDKNDISKFYIAKGVETLSTLENDPDHIARIRSLSADGLVEITVKTERLDEILLNRGLSKPDFITIDVEGHEMMVLKGLSLDLIVPRILIIEDNSNGFDLSIDRYLRSHKYIKFKRTGCNDWYANRNDPVVSYENILMAYLKTKYFFLKKKLKNFMIKSRIL